MKTITVRQFFRSPANVTALDPGQSLVVTEQGRPSFIVTKAPNRPRKTIEDLEREARYVSPKSGPKVNFTEAIRELKGR